MKNLNLNNPCLWYKFKFENTLPMGDSCVVVFRASDTFVLEGLKTLFKNICVEEPQKIEEPYDLQFLLIDLKMENFFSLGYVFYYKENTYLMGSLRRNELLNLCIEETKVMGSETPENIPNHLFILKNNLNADYVKPISVEESYTYKFLQQSKVFSKLNPLISHINHFLMSSPYYNPHYNYSLFDFKNCFEEQDKSYYVVVYQTARRIKLLDEPKLIEKINTFVEFQNSLTDDINESVLDHYKLVNEDGMFKLYCYVKPFANGLASSKSCKP